MGNRAAHYGNCKSPYSAPADGKSAGTDDLHYSFGTASVKYKILDDNKIIFSGFKDTYNFDPKPWGVRSFKNEVITRTYNKISNGTDFSIYYNKKIF